MFKKNCCIWWINWVFDSIRLRRLCRVIPHALVLKTFLTWKMSYRWNSFFSSHRNNAVFLCWGMTSYNPNLCYLNEFWKNAETPKWSRYIFGFQHSKTWAGQHCRILFFYGIYWSKFSWSGNYAKKKYITMAKYFKITLKPEKCDFLIIMRNQNEILSFASLNLWKLVECINNLSM